MCLFKAALNEGINYEHYEQARRNTLKVHRTSSIANSHSTIVQVARLPDYVQCRVQISSQLLLSLCHYINRDLLGDNGCCLRVAEEIYASMSCDQCKSLDEGEDLCDVANRLVIDGFQLRLRQETCNRPSNRPSSIKLHS